MRKGILCLLTVYKAATPITVGDISLGDRVLIRGRASDDQKSVAAACVIVMAKTDLEKAREAEQLRSWFQEPSEIWEQR